MRITCISASNVKHAGANSTSLRVCRLLEKLVSRQEADATVEIVALVNHELRPCIGCGGCFEAGRCAHDEAFNEVYSRLATADGLFIVSAHYAPIPAKLSMLLEKIEQLAFLRRFHDEARCSPLCHKPVGIVGHGGGTEEIVRHYKALVLDPIANALDWPVEMDIVAAGPEWPNGVVFPVKRVGKDERSRFPVQEYDWLDVERRLEPLVTSMLRRLDSRRRAPQQCP